MSDAVKNVASAVGKLSFADIRAAKTTDLIAAQDLAQIAIERISVELTNRFMAIPPRSDEPPAALPQDDS